MIAPVPADADRGSDTEGDRDGERRPPGLATSPAEVEELKRQFVATARHELRTPLTAILGLSEMLEQRGELLDPAVRKDLAGRIRRQAERLRTLVDDLLTTSALDAGRFPVHPEPLRLAPLLAEALAGLPEPEDAALSCEEDLWVVADADRLEQIVANLLSNALRYGAPPVELVARAEGDWVWLEVRDHGEGVPPSFEPLLFERFTRGPGSAERSSQGTGLGLAIVAKLAELHGGQVAYRRDGEVTVFAVSLPRLTPVGRDQRR